MNTLRQFSRFLVLYAGCGFVWPLFAAPPTPPDERDRQVIETVLLHLLSDSQFNLTRGSDTGTNIVLNIQTPNKTGMIRPGQMSRDIGKGNTIPTEIQEALLSRNEKPGS